MSTLTFAVALALLSLLTDAVYAASGHAVSVYVKRSGGDIGSTATLGTQVIFNGVSEFQKESGIEKHNVFSGNGKSIFRYLFPGDGSVSSITVVVREIDNPSTGVNDDGVCRIVIKPIVQALDSAMYECVRTPPGGNPNDTWIIRIQISYFSIGR